jgi:hypothetical protein
VFTKEGKSQKNLKPYRRSPTIYSLCTEKYY